MEPLLSVTEQLEIIREVRKRFNELIDTKLNTGLCILMYRSLFRKRLRYEFSFSDGWENYDYHIPNCIPGFTYENAVKHCGASIMDKCDFYDYYWWDVEDFESRLKFLDWLEEDLLK